MCLGGLRSTGRALRERESKQMIHVILFYVGHGTLYMRTVFHLPAVVSTNGGSMDALLRLYTTVEIANRFCTQLYFYEIKCEGNGTF